jgi:23S rRNA (uridine2552-2'-O)-methyltransferase
MVDWINRQKNDIFVRKRNDMNLISRSYFKVEDICEKFRLLKLNGKILELGSAPGGWTQFFKKKNQYVVGVDLLPMKVMIDEFFQQDICEDLNLDYKFDNIFSDIAPNLSGNKCVDEGNMCDVINAIENVIRKNLKIGGNLIIKVFVGASLDLCNELFNKNFRQIKIFKPSASRKESSEMYFIAMNYY